MVYFHPSHLITPPPTPPSPPAGIACEPVAPTIDESCGLETLTCGDSFTGTTVGFANWIGTPAPDAVYVISLFNAADLTLTTCGSLTSFDVRLSLWDSNPAEPKEAHELVSNDEGMPCATLHWQIPKAMSVYLVVEGAAAGEEGIFELLVLCKELPSETEDAVCANDFITCGDVKDATTVGFDNFVGSTSGDRFFLVTAFEATDITATTCGAITSFPTVISLYDGYPTNSTLMGKSDPSAPCGMLFATLPAAGAYYLVVDGVGDMDEGVFSLTLLCAEKEAKTLADSCSLQFLTCGDVVTVSGAASVGYRLAAPASY